MPEYEMLLAELRSGDESRAQAAVEQLARADASVVPRLLEQTSSSNPDQRWWAVRALAESPHTRGADLISLIDDPDPAVRQAALLALGGCGCGSEVSIPKLVSALAEQDQIASGLAMVALVNIGRASVPALIEAARRPPLASRALALRALAQLRDHRAIPVMMQALEEDSALLGHWAGQGLEWLGLDMVYIKP